MKNTLLLILTFISALLQAQQFECETILTAPLAINNCSSENQDSCIIYDLQKIYECGGFSPVDKLVLEPVVVANQLHSRIDFDSTTYGEAFQAYRQVLASPAYAKMKAFKLSLSAFEKSSVNEENWKQFSNNLRTGGYTAYELDSLKPLFFSRHDSSLTFKQAWLLAKNPAFPISNPKPTSLRRAFKSFQSLEWTMAMAIRKNKTALIFFGDVTDIHAITFIRTIVETDKNLEIINSDFDPYYAFTNRTSELDNYEKIALGLNPDSTITIGSYATKIRTELASAASPTPLIIILNNDGTVRDSFGQTDEPEKLTNFLNENKYVR